MTDSPHPGEPVETAPHHGDSTRSLALLALFGVVVVAIGLVLLWQGPTNGPGLTQAQIDVIMSKARQVDAVAARVSALETKPQATTDLAPLTARIDALEKRPEATPTNLAPIESRLAALEGRPVGANPADIASLASRLDAFAQRSDQIAQHEQTDASALSAKLDKTSADLTAKVDTATTDLGAKLDGTTGPLAAKLDSATTELGALSTKLDATSSDSGKALAALTSRVDALDQRLGKLETDSAQLTTLADKTRLLARLQAAQAALDAGDPLGDVPGAPPAIAKFAHDAPPTLASLRLSYKQAAAAAQQASLPNTGGDHPLVDRMWARMQQTVTVRQGDDLLVGSPSGGVLARAGSALDAGDLPGAVSILSALTGPPLDAMKPWLDQAHALLDARAALASLEGQA